MTQSWLPEPIELAPPLTPIEELQQLLRGDAWGSATLTSADQKALRFDS